MRVNMFRLRWTIEAQPRSKKGHPPHSTTGVASANSTHPNIGPGLRPENMMASSGTVSAAPIHRRRVILFSSGLVSPAVTVSGSSAMPQMGQAPGPGRTISGCMGQVYSADAEDVGAELIVTSGAEPSYLAGLASNFILQPCPQKYQVR